MNPADSRRTAIGGLSPRPGLEILVEEVTKDGDGESLILSRPATRIRFASLKDS